jgi:hypothetical protein
MANYITLLQVCQMNCLFRVKLEYTQLYFSIDKYIRIERPEGPVLLSLSGGYSGQVVGTGDGV